MESKINRPSHYGSGLQPWDLMVDQDIAIPFAVGNIIKYVCRFRAKNGLEDLRKAQWYMNKLVELAENEEAAALRHDAGNPGDARSSASGSPASSHSG